MKTVFVTDGTPLDHPSRFPKGSVAHLFQDRELMRGAMDHNRVSCRVVADLYNPVWVGMPRGVYEAVVEGPND
jgi:hypothetical protein